MLYRVYTHDGESTEFEQEVRNSERFTIQKQEKDCLFEVTGPANAEYELKQMKQVYSVTSEQQPKIGSGP